MGNEEGPNAVGVFICVTLITIFFWLCLIPHPVCADNKVAQSIDEALSASPLSRERSVLKYIEIAKDLLEAKLKRVGRLFSTETVKLLNEFIEVGESIQRRDCSDRSRRLMNSFPFTITYSSWDEAVDVFVTKFNEICLEKQLGMSLDGIQMSKVKKLADLSLPIIDLNEELNNHLSKQGVIPITEVVNTISRCTRFFDELKTDGSSKFNEKLLEYLQQESKQGDLRGRLAEAFDHHVTKPCRYYTYATSGIFSDSYSVTEGDEFHYLYFEYKLCRYILKEHTHFLHSLENSVNVS